MRTEEELVRALRQAAELAPQRDLTAAIAVRRRRRTKHRRMGAALAVAAVIGVAGAGTAIARGVFSGGGEGGVASRVSESPGEAVASIKTPPKEQAHRKPIEEVWPKALFTMPAKNADGWRYRPITGISPTEVLVTAQRSWENTGAIEIYNSETRAFRKVTDIPATPGLKHYTTRDLAFDDKSVVWWVYADDKVREIWTAPLAGGEARMVATFTREHLGIGAMAVKGEHVYWSEDDGTVWHLPLAGGDPEKIAEGLHLISWPWAGDVSSLERDSDVNQTKVVNLETGETRRITASPGARGLRCGPVWCLGARFSQRVDGTDVDPIGSFSGPLSPRPILDRYLFVGRTVRDLETGAKLALPENPSNVIGTGIADSSAPSTITYWGATKGVEPDTFRIVNLAAAQ